MLFKLQSGGWAYMHIANDLDTHSRTPLEDNNLALCGQLDHLDVCHIPKLPVNSNCGYHLGPIHRLHQISNVIGFWIITLTQC